MTYNASGEKVDDKECSWPYCETIVEYEEESLCYTHEVRKKNPVY